MTNVMEVIMTLKELCKELEGIKQIVELNYASGSDNAYLEVSLDPCGSIEISYREWWKSSEWTLFSIDSDVENIRKDLKELRYDVGNKKLSWA